MKKTKQIHSQTRPELTPEQVLQFMSDFSETVHGIDKKTKLISLRVPENILNSFKVKAKLDNRKYQSLIVQLMRDWIKK